MLRVFKKYVFETALIMLLGFFAFFLHGTEERIIADGTGYYDYLPSLFIHHDLVRKEKTPGNDRRVGKMPVYVNYDGGKVNKYHCGTTILLSPFFLVTHVLYSGNEFTGYEKPFQLAILFAALFYAWLALIFFRKLLELYPVKRVIVHATQFILIMGTNVLYYVTVESSFSHIYSLFAIAVFLYCAKKYFTHGGRKYMVWAFVFLALIILIRPINVLVVLFIPFIAGSGAIFFTALRNVFRDKKGMLLSLLFFVLVLSVQPLLWYAQTGKFLVYSYQNEGFDFTNAHFWSILFSFRKGLFVYTPVLLIALFGLFHYARIKSWYVVVTFIVPFILLTYVLASWHDWVYGYSYGLRAFIDYYPLFFILLAVMLNETPGVKKLIWIPVALTVPLNLIQTWQYKHFILHWHQMDFQKYCTVFLKTSDPYRGLLWKQELTKTDFLEPERHLYAQRSVAEYQVDTVINSPLGSFATREINAAMLEVQSDFPADNNTQIELNIMDSTGTRVIYTRSAYLIHFAEKPFGVEHFGHHWYDFRGLPISTSDRLLVRIFNGDKRLDAITVNLSLFSKVENW